MNEEQKKASVTLVQSGWKTVTAFGMGCIFKDIAMTFTPKPVGTMGRIARCIGAYTLADAVCDKLTDQYIDKRFEEMTAKLEEAKKEKE